MVTDNLSPLRKWGSLVVLSLALAIIILDTTILNVSLSTIIRDFHTDIQSIQWVITAYSLTLAALTVTGGRLGDIYGRKRMFVTGAIIFAIGSFITSISQNIPTMIAGESIIEGIGAALMMPATSSLLLSTFRGRERAIAFGVWGGIAAASAALGPIIGGYLTTHYSWRLGFRVNVIVAAVLCIASFVIKEARDREEKPTIDWVGVLLSATGLTIFVFGIIEASTYGWWYAKQALSFFGHQYYLRGNLSIVPFAIFFGTLVILLFAAWEGYIEESGRTPLVSLRLFKNRQFTSGTITTLVLSLGQSGLIFALPVFLQSVRGLSAFDTGLSLLPMSLTILIIAPLAAALSHKISPKRLIQLGLLLFIAAYVVIYFSMSVDSTAWSLAPGLALFGAGMGLVMSQINNITLSAVSVQQAGEASGVNNTMRQIGSSMGSAIIGAVLLTTLTANLATGVQNSTVIPAALKPQISQAVANQTSSVEFGGGAQVNSHLPASIRNEIIAIGHQATVDANKTSLLYGALFALLGFVVALWLPNVAVVDHGQSLAVKDKPTSPDTQPEAAATPASALVAQPITTPRQLLQLIMAEPPGPERNLSPTELAHYYKQSEAEISRAMTLLADSEQALARRLHEVRHHLAVLRETGQHAGPPRQSGLDIHPIERS